MFRAAKTTTSFGDGDWASTGTGSTRAAEAAAAVVATTAGAADDFDTPLPSAAAAERESGAADGGAPELTGADGELRTNWDEATDSFDDMGLSPAVLRGVFAYGFERPSPVQSLAIQPFLAGRDVVAQAQSGTGKTGAFSTALLARLLALEAGGSLRRGAGVRIIVLSPTHDLARQTLAVVQDIGRYAGVGGGAIATHLAVGKTRFGDDVRALRGGRVEVVVGTPGRVAHLLSERVIDGRGVAMLCLDEADELLAEGFEEQLEEVKRHLVARDVQVCMFSATMPPEARRLAAEWLRSDAAVVLLEAERVTLDAIANYFVYHEGRGARTVDQEKLDTLVDLWACTEVGQSIVFVNTVSMCVQLTGELARAGYPCEAMHRDLDAVERRDVMRRFRTGEARVLVASDIVARGIDVQGVSVVVNFEFPDRAETYMHRVGRSARWGRKGVAINLLGPRETRSLEAVERTYGVVIEAMPSDPAAAVHRGLGR